MAGTPRFNFFLWVRYRKRNANTLRTLAYLRFKSYHRYGILPHDPQRTCNDLGICLKTYKKHLTWLKAHGLISTTRIGYLRIVSFDTLKLRTGADIRLTLKDILDKDLFDAKCFAAWVEYKSRVQAYIARKKAPEQTTTPKNKEARTTHRGKRQANLTARLSFSYIARALGTGNTTIKKLRKCAAAHDLLRFGHRCEVLEFDRHQLWVARYDDKPIYVKKDAGIVINHTTEYKVFRYRLNCGMVNRTLKNL